MEDDPREVLTLLNSLGFIGITASQLKAFMKDLKLYRKMKERERQQRRDDITRKIIHKQQTMLQEILRERSSDIQSSTISSGSTPEEPWVKLKVTYETEQESDEESESTKENYASCRRTRTSRTNLLQNQRACENIKPCIKRNHDKNEKEQLNNNIKSAKDKNESNSIQQSTISSNSHPLEPLPTQASARSYTAASTKSSAHTGSKSFIRPWRLHPEVQSAPRNVRSLDPVALYQKYQKEWKQMSLPGEAKHTAIRWAIREKMLGTDPHPLPIPLTAREKRIPSSRRK